MSTHNIYFHDKIEKKILKISLIKFVISGCQENVLGPFNLGVRISQSKRAIGFPASEVLLYREDTQEMPQ